MRNSFFVVIILLILVIGSFVVLKYRSSTPSSFNTAQVTTESLTPTEKPNIVVSSPKADEVISSPVTVQGEARVFENVFQIRLLDQDGNTLVDANVTANSSDMGQFGPFQHTLAFPPQNGKSGSLKVYSLSAKDGSEINNITIPIHFAK